MIKNDYLHSGHIFEKDEKLLAYQFQFFNVMLALATLFSPFIAYLHRGISHVLFYSDMMFSITSLMLILALRISKNNFRLASYLFIPSLYITITLVFFNAGDDPTKVIWAPIFFACAFLLQGGRLGLLWLTAVLVSYFFGFYIYGEEGIYYSLEELFLISIAFITVSMIFNAFRRKNDADNKSMMASNISLQESAATLEAFNKGLELRIADALAESQNKTQAIQNHLDVINQNVITAHIDLNGLITNVSEAYCKVSKYKKAHFISKPFTLLFDIDTPMQELKGIWTDLENEKEYIGDVKGTDARGSSYWLNINISPEYTSAHEHIGYVCIAHDITDKKLVLQQQEQLISQSRHAAMGEMISMIAHQWRQPLATISAIATGVSMDLGLGSLDEKKLEGKIEGISKQVQHLSRTVDDFRDFFKPNKGLENTYVHALLEEAVKLLDHRLGQGIQVIYKEKTDICLALYHNELVQVLINILNNACDELIEREIVDPYISINEYIQDQKVVIEIADNAGGIDGKVIKNIFDPYFSTKTKNGTGLGLYMSKTIVEDHQKGTLEAFNHKSGAMFKISIPLDVCKI